MIYAELSLVNGDDLALLCRNIIGHDEVKQMWVNALDDTGSYMLCINENIRSNCNCRL